MKDNFLIVLCLGLLVGMAISVPVAKQSDKSFRLSAPINFEQAKAEIFNAQLGEVNVAIGKSL